MSYILEALKKAERERGLAQVPRLTTVHDLEAARRNNPALLAGGLVVCAVAVLWFIVSIANMVMRPPVSAPADLGQGSPAAISEGSFPEPASVERPALVPSGEMPLYPGEGPSGGAMQKSLETGPPVVSQSADEESVTRRSDPQPLSAPLIESELPLTGVTPGSAGASETTASSGPAQAKPHSLKEAVAGMTLSLLMYAEAEEDRVVYINGRKYAKGDYIDERYLIENITLDGVVLSYQGDQAILRPN